MYKKGKQAQGECGLHPLSYLDMASEVHARKTVLPLHQIIFLEKHPAAIFQKSKYCLILQAFFLFKLTHIYLLPRRSYNKEHSQSLQVIKRLPWSPWEAALIIGERASIVVPVVLNDYLETPGKSELAPERNCLPPTLPSEHLLLPCGL